jgi:hypothetical protein
MPNHSAVVPYTARHAAPEPSARWLRDWLTAVIAMWRGEQ